MGCSSSKHFEKQNLMERWMSSDPVLDSCAMEAADLQPFEYYHHILALTTRSYGILRILSPEAATTTVPRKCVHSLSELYDNFRRLEASAMVVASAATSPPPPPPPPAQNLPSNRSSRPSVDSKTGEWIDENVVTQGLVEAEVIDVEDMMQGLEEAEADEEECAASTVTGSPATKSEFTMVKCRLGDDDDIPAGYGHSAIQGGRRRSLQEPQSSGNRRRSSTEATMTMIGDQEKDTVVKGGNKRKCVATLFIPTMAMSKRMAIGIGGVPSPGPTTPLFDPDLIATYEAKLAEDLSEGKWGKNSSNNRAKDPFAEFQWLCPPSGSDKLVIYTTTLGGIRKTFEDCNTVRDIFKSFDVCIDERDVSMHQEFLNELKQLMGGKKEEVVTVPRVFIKGRYIGSKEHIIQLHDDGKLSQLLKGLPKSVNGGNCDGCDGIRFVPCLECRGSCKLRDEQDMLIRCPDCNENGLIQCPICT